MAKFLDTQGVSYFLGQLINNSKDKLYLISPYLQLNNQLKIALADKAKFRLDIVMIYGKVADLNPIDSEWLESTEDIKLLFHQDLHAKCYISESEAIVTSMNLYMFSQQNNVEMGIYVSKKDDEELFNSILKEADKIKRGSEHRRISIQKVPDTVDMPKQDFDNTSPNTQTSKNIVTDYSDSNFKSTSGLAKTIGTSSKHLFQVLQENGWIIKDDKSWVLTEIGEQHGGQMKSGQYGEYAAWPEEIFSEIFDLLD
ncbi:MAG: DNA repair protein [Candidatus Sabulitectum sp.]|nr:DNA repair protein [Candidatus Sabulitectum sp.]